MNEMEQNAEVSANETDYSNDMSDFGVADESNIGFDESLSMDESNMDSNGMSL